MSDLAILGGTPTISGEPPAPAPPLQVRITPNPIVRQDHPSGVSFTDLMEQSTLCIYTASGRHVRTLESPSGGETSWNLSNSGGGTIAPGIYVFVLDDISGVRKSGKLVVK